MAAAQKQLISASKLANQALLKDAGNDEAKIQKLSVQLGVVGKPVQQNSELMNKALELIEELKAVRSS
jgi:hypothetical protein